MRHASTFTQRSPHNFTPKTHSVSLNDRRYGTIYSFPNSKNFVPQAFAEALQKFMKLRRIVISHIACLCCRTVFSDFFYRDHLKCPRPQIVKATSNRRGQQAKCSAHCRDEMCNLRQSFGVTFPLRVFSTKKTESIALQNRVHVI